MAGERGSAVEDNEVARRRLGRGLGYATRVQVTAHQFMARRAALGLTRRQVRMEAEPGRREWMAVLAGLSIVVVICLGALFWSFIRPAGSVGGSKIIADQDSGALYVNVNDVLYPALNLSSARLIAGQADNPVRVRRSEIDSRPRGVMVGIPGAPNAMNATAPVGSSWLVCDAVTKAFGAGAPEPVTVTVLDGQPDLSDRRRVLDKSDGVLLRFGADVWLIRDGRRSLVDASQRPVLLALGVTAEDLASARPMSQALLNAIPVAAPLTVPNIPGLGNPAPFPGAPGPVGTVVSTPQVEGNTTYSVVLLSGMQTISPIVAQILQNAGGNVSGTIPVIAGSKLSALPSVNRIDTSIYPDEPLKVVDTQANPATCWWWQRGAGENRAVTSVVSGASIPVPAERSSEIVKLVQSDTAGGQADQVYFGPDYANFVVSTGNGPTASTTESVWWLSESGIRFGINRDKETLNALGLGTPPSPAPWAVLRLFAGGPTLSKVDALVRHNTLPMDRSPGEFEQPK
ncbi:type VII secretion protein EccB [Mycobacterium sp. URHB0021]